MEKPAYKVPSMREIEALEWNGYSVASTFSGGGGSCLGYRMAGYRVLYANEFVEEAQRTYKVNHPDSFLDTRDIRAVTGADILQRIGMQPGELDLFDGSPPCCAFSTAGAREKGWGQQKQYSDGKVQQVDNLFFEYARLVKEIQPKVFVAENVSGLVKGTAKGYFKLIIKELTACGYEVKAGLLNAAWLGVPQARERIIFMGVRKDLVEKCGVHPTFPKPLKYQYTMGDALQGVDNDPAELEQLREDARKYAFGKVLRKIEKNPKKKISGAKVANGSYFNLHRESMHQPCSTMCQTGGIAGAATNCHPLEDRKFTIPELRRITSLPDDFILTGEYRQQYERAARMVPPVMMSHIARTVKEEILWKIR